MNLANLKKVLVISPHPDDSEYSCYGIIKKMSCETHVLVCSKGGKGDQTNSRGRVQETLNFWNDFKKTSVVQEDLLRLEYHEVVKFLDSYIQKNSFDAIFVPPEKDTNQEHRFISKACKSSLRNKSTILFEYQTPSTTHNWSPNFWVDISGILEEKKSMISLSFESQKHKPYFESDYLDLFHQDWQAFKRGIKYCEKFKLVSWMFK